MSLGIAAVVTGPQRSVFVKASDGVSNPFAHAAYAAEAEYAARLPRHPSIPALLDRVEVDVDGVAWSASAFEAVSGRTPGHPWRRDEFVRVLDAWAELEPALQGTAWDDPSPAAVTAFMDRWQLIADEPSDPWHPWAERWADPAHTLALGCEGPDSVLAHVDLRADNIVLGDRVAFVDWAHPGLAAPWFDVLTLVLDAAGSGPDFDVVELWEQHPATACWPVTLLPAGAAALGAGLHVGNRQPVAGLPHRSTWQRALADGLLGFANDTWERGIRP